MKDEPQTAVRQRKAAGGTTRKATPTKSGTGRPRSAKVREAIIDATLLILKKDGLRNLTIEGVAKKAGVGKATIYRWWPSRISLVLEAMENLPELPTPDTGNFADDLRITLTGLAHLLATSPLQSVLAHLGAEGSDVADHQVTEYLGRRMSVSDAMFERAIARGELPASADINSLVFLTMGPVINRAFFGAPPDAAFIELVVQTMVVGCPAGFRAVN